MTYTIPSSEPSLLVAGTTWQWRRTDGTFPGSEGWTLTYYVRGLDSLDITATYTAPNPYYDVSVSATTTAGLRAGRYEWSAWVSKAGEIHEAGNGVFILEPNIQTAPAGALQTHAERTLAVIEAALEGRLTSDLESYSIAGRSVTKIPLRELTQLAGVYRAMVWREQNPGRLGPPIEAIMQEPGWPWR